MACMCSAVALLALFLLSFQQCYCVPGDPVMYLPPFEVRTIENNRVNFPFGNSIFQPINQPADATFAEMQQQPIMHTTPAPTVQSIQTNPIPIKVEEKQDTKRHNFTLNEFVEALNHLENDEESHDQARADGYGYPQYSYPTPSAHGYPATSAYGYPRPYGSYSYPQRPPAYGPMASYHEPAAYMPPATIHRHHPGAKTLKPELTSLLVKPLATKAASKVSGLIGLVLSLFGGSGNSEMKGFMDIVINGIVKPLLAAKGGIKSLISKLTIPVISLLLINLEVLITVWWLWEDCPEPVPVAPAPVYPYPKPAYPNYSSNSYR